MKQQTFSDIEYSSRKRKTKREEFLEIMDEIIPWDEFLSFQSAREKTGTHNTRAVYEKLFSQAADERHVIAAAGRGLYIPPGALSVERSDCGQIIPGLHRAKHSAHCGSQNPPPWLT